MPDYQFDGHHVRVVWRDFRPPGGKVEYTIFRGQVLQTTHNGLWLWGRFFLEKPDSVAMKEVPKEKDSDLRIYFATWNSIESLEIIEENTQRFENHKMILSRTSTVKTSTPGSATPNPESPK